jgi:ATPase subunit of ABC transporter with duplicated ATPase domains
MGVHEPEASSVLKTLSGGLKSRVVLAAAVWSSPHLVCLDEPTNFLDKNTLNALVEALTNFKGAVVVISHNQEFVDKVAQECWLLQDGCLTVTPAGTPLDTCNGGAHESESTQSESESTQSERAGAVEKTGKVERVKI